MRPAARAAVRKGRLPARLIRAERRFALLDPPLRQRGAIDAARAERRNNETGLGPACNLLGEVVPVEERRISRLEKMNWRMNK